jgi:hypothetical protein
MVAKECLLYKMNRRTEAGEVLLSVADASNCRLAGALLRFIRHTQCSL